MSKFRLAALRHQAVRIGCHILSKTYFSDIITLFMLL